MANYFHPVNMLNMRLYDKLEDIVCLNIVSIVAVILVLIFYNFAWPTIIALQWMYYEVTFTSAFK